MPAVLWCFLLNRTALLLHKYVSILSRDNKMGKGLIFMGGPVFRWYSVIMFSAPVGSHCLHFFWCLCSLTSWPLVRIPTYRTHFLHIMLVVLCAFLPHAVLLIILENTQIWFCSSVDFIDSVLNPSPFCTLSGIQLLCWFCHPVHTCRELTFWR